MGYAHVVVVVVVAIAAAAVVVVVVGVVVVDVVVVVVAADVAVVVILVVLIFVFLGVSLPWSWSWLRLWWCLSSSSTPSSFVIVIVVRRRRCRRRRPSPIFIFQKSVIILDALLQCWDAARSKLGVRGGSEQKTKTPSTLKGARPAITHTFHMLESLLKVNDWGGSLLRWGPGSINHGPRLAVICFSCHAQAPAVHRCMPWRPCLRPPSAMAPGRPRATHTC